MLCETNLKNAAYAPVAAAPCVKSGFPGGQFRSRPSSGTNRLARCVLALAGNQPALIRHIETPWASITFSGKRHTITLQFKGTDGIAAAEQFIAALPDHEFTLPGTLVADAAVTSADHRRLPHEILYVTVEILLLDEA